MPAASISCPLRGGARGLALRVRALDERIRGDGFCLRIARRFARDETAPEQRLALLVGSAGILGPASRGFQAGAGGVEVRRGLDQPVLQPLLLMNDGAALDLELALQAFELGLCLLRIGADVTVLEAREDLAGAHALARLGLDARHDTLEARADLGELAADHRVARHHVVGLVVKPQPDGRRDEHEYRARDHPGDMAAARRDLRELGVHA